MILHSQRKMLHVFDTNLRNTYVYVRVRIETKFVYALHEHIHQVHLGPAVMCLLCWRGVVTVGALLLRFIAPKSWLICFPMNSDYLSTTLLLV